jgi:hypothetical protein
MVDEELGQDCLQDTLQKKKMQTGKQVKGLL